MILQHCPHHSLCFHTPPNLLIGLQSLRCCGALRLCLQRRLPSLHPYSACPTCLQHCLPSLCSQCPPDMPLTPPSHWPDPYAPAAPHLHPYHPHLFFSAAYNSYAPAAPSRYASDPTLNPPIPNPLSAAYHPYAQVLDP
ncbi:hypothetical protein O181_112447 [Austropuccinia psidii MF-1]|uniref:Uncharacterized protein n=1 Tax=Austropuccinia psidii MF-1 TaxID=1389203 RepID=A0A9Q3K3Q5_9BASI|nr:hypothetical protein [Austropuccinia psidii MF-1]